MSDSEARAKLVPGVKIGSGVSLQDIQEATINEANRVQGLCDCQIVITSGTEGAHASGTFSHANGFKMDLASKNNFGQPNNLTNYILSNPEFYYDRNRCNGTRDGANCNGTWEAVYKSRSDPNVEYVWEAKGTSNEHWDVLVKS